MDHLNISCNSGMCYSHIPIRRNLGWQSGHPDVCDPVSHLMLFYYYVSFAVEICILDKLCIKCLGVILIQCLSSMAWTKQDITRYHFGFFCKKNVAIYQLPQHASLSTAFLLTAFEPRSG